MTNAFILSHIDHTLLKPTASWEEIQTLCQEAITYKTASVCVPPSYVLPIHKQYGETLTICTVIGFPLGYSYTAAKTADAVQAIADGATEIDMVINITDAKEHRFDNIRQEIQSLREATQGYILKVIIETCYLTEEEKIELCHIITECKADYIKTSTGFGTGGATIHDIELFKTHIGPLVKIKAAGGVKTREDLETFIAMGCHRIGTSSAVKLLAGETADSY